MFAIIDFGGSQRRVKKDDIFQTNKVAYNVGDEFVIGQVVDISSNGRKVWVETHEDTYCVDRLKGELKEI
jgi:ribosomal protein L21